MSASGKPTISREFESGASGFRSSVRQHRQELILATVGLLQSFGLPEQLHLEPLLARDVGDQAERPLDDLIRVPDRIDADAQPGFAQRDLANLSAAGSEHPLEEWPPAIGRDAQQRG